MNTNEAKKTTGMANGSQMRITDPEIDLIKATYGNNEPLLKLLRKMFLPELDPNAPIGQMIDLYRTIETKERNPMDVAVDLTARNMLISHVDNVLMQLQLIGKMDRLTPEEAVAKVKANSTK